MDLSNNRTNVARSSSLLQFPRPQGSSFSLLGTGSELHDALYYTISAEQELENCLRNSISNATIISTVTSSPEECKEAQGELKRNFTKAYVAIKTLKDSYDEARND